MGGPLEKGKKGRGISISCCYLDTAVLCIGRNRTLQLNITVCFVNSSQEGTEMNRKAAKTLLSQCSIIIIPSRFCFLWRQNKVMILKAVSIQVCTSMKAQGFSSFQSILLVKVISVLCIEKLLTRKVYVSSYCLFQTAIFEITMNSSINHVLANAY